METERSLTCSQDPATGPCLEPDESKTHQEFVVTSGIHGRLIFQYGSNCMRGTNIYEKVERFKGSWTSVNPLKPGGNYMHHLL
jgi:hypothetical protein